MSDESFFREVNEEIRQDRTRQIWARYGRVIIALAVLAVIATGGYVAWREYSISQANQSGDRFIAALDLAATDKPDEALAALGAMVEEGHGVYRDLARMRVAALQEKQGAKADAIAGFDAVAGDSSVPRPIRDMAAIRAAYILVDTGSLDDVSQRVVQLSGDDQPLRHPAREVLGLAAWKAGDAEDAKRYFGQLRDDQSTPSGIAIRARLMLELIEAGSRPIAVDPAAPAPATAAPAAPAATDAPAAQAPAAPAAPESSAAPASPAAPAAPAETTAPADTIAPTAPAETTAPSEPVAPASDAAPVTPAPASPAAPAGTAAPAN